MGCQFDSPLWIGERRTQINIEEFQGSLNSKQTIQLLEIVWRARRQRTEDKRASFSQGPYGLLGDYDLVPCHRPNEFVGCIAHGIHGCDYGPSGNTDSSTAHKFDVDPF